MSDYDGLDVFGIEIDLQLELEELVDGNDDYDERVTATVPEVMALVDKLLTAQAWQLTRDGMTCCPEQLVLNDKTTVECMGEKDHPGETHGTHLLPELLKLPSSTRIVTTWTVGDAKEADDGGE